MTDRRNFYESRAAERPREQLRYYHRLLERYFRFLIPENASVLEIGCGIGDLLASLKPKRGVGIDFSASMIALAQNRHPSLQFITAEAGSIPLDEKFDYIVLSDLVNDLPDVQSVLEHVRKFAHPGSRLVLNFFNNVWRPILGMAEETNHKAPTLEQNWLSSTDMRNLLNLAGWELIKRDTRILFPLELPLVEPFFNQLLAPILAPFCLTIFQVARLQPATEQPHYSCSVIVPARNEQGNILAAVERIPEMGKGTEIIFIEGHSRDRTWAEIHSAAEKYPGRKIKILKQQTKGKGGAVREAFDQAAGEILFILDADLTVPPEQLTKFYDAVRMRGEFINGVRLVYPMENEAMQFLNMVANKIFGLAFSWLIGQSIKDTLCGTKVLFRSDYEKIKANRAYFGEFDPFGDFDLLFGAAKLNLKIIDLPVRYQARTYGSTNIHRWSHGMLLLRMVMKAAGRLKFI
ncbi:MAG: glycosyltransferase [Verrucomicrobiales bacterium]